MNPNKDRLGKPARSAAAMASMDMPSMPLKKRYSPPGAETDAVAQAGVLDEHMDYTKQQLVSLREKLESTKDPETKADIQKDLDYWLQHGLRMSKMGYAGDQTDNVESAAEEAAPVKGQKAAAKFDMSRPLGMR